MAGIYIHIPFCKKACHYCDFHFSTSLQNKDAFLSALKKEIRLQKNYLKSELISTVYFGGGTPSLLSEKELNEIFDCLKDYFQISEDAEITLEANPDDLTINKIIDLKGTPVNRLSIGVQSFYDEDLELMNRAHNSDEAINAVKFAQENGFDNITIDLIYGTPTLSHHHWRNNLQIAFALDVKHISAYCLTVEPKTALAHKINKGQVKNIDEQHGSEQFEIMLEAMHKNDFIQYEISNFCKDGKFSKHNSNYWLKEKYLGLGPSAHSYNGESRQWNISNNALYIQSLEKGMLSFEKEELSIDQRYNEYVLTSLRTIWGLDLNYLEQNFGKKQLEYCLIEVGRYIQTEHVLNEENKLYLSDKGKLIADK
ncbi:MAG: radical SAM family heme chaperone HemW, partial [Bacteroidetes bacterium]|nr:radical SAM family heme chaperone HemW [Bacteroidota bacterium]